MAHDSILLEKSLTFAARIMKLHKYLIKDKKEHIISKQIIRSATSIGANANEAIYGASKADFIAIKTRGGNPSSFSYALFIAILFKKLYN